VADAEVIPIGTGGRPGRGTGKAQIQTNKKIKSLKTKE